MVPIFTGELAPGVRQVVIQAGDIGGLARSVWREEQGVLMVPPGAGPDDVVLAVARLLTALWAGHEPVTEVADPDRILSEMLV